MALARAAPPDAGGSFLDWWLGELRALLPHGWREQKPRRFGVVLVLERPYVRVFERRGRRLAMLGSLVLADPDGAIPTPTPEARLRRAIERHRDERSSSWVSRTLWSAPISCLPRRNPISPASWRTSSTF